MNKERIRAIVQFAVAVAGDKDDPFDRQLGPIHLIKYVYLADLEYAKRNNGQTYTGIAWVFHHFGPWSLELYESLDTTLQGPNFSKSTFQMAPKDSANWANSETSIKDITRWEVKPSARTAVRKTGDVLPVVCAAIIEGSVKRFGRDTHPLLHEVYRTKPMLQAKPGELLRFEAEPKPEVAAAPPTRNPKLKRKLRAVWQKWQKDQPNDDLWYGGPQQHLAAGLAVFDAIEASDLQECTLEAELDESVWTWGDRDPHDRLSL